MYKLEIYHNGFGNCPNEYVQPHIKWCKNNASGFWVTKSPYTGKIENGFEMNLNYTFIFEEESDAMAFKLRWK